MKPTVEGGMGPVPPQALTLKGRQPVSFHSCSKNGTQAPTLSLQAAISVTWPEMSASGRKLECVHAVRGRF